MPRTTYFAGGMTVQAVIAMLLDEMRQDQDFAHFLEDPLRDKAFVKFAPASIAKCHEKMQAPHMSNIPKDFFFFARPRCSRASAKPLVLGSEAAHLAASLLQRLQAVWKKTICPGPASKIIQNLSTTKGVWKTLELETAGTAWQPRNGSLDRSATTALPQKRSKHLRVRNWKELCLRRPFGQCLPSMMEHVLARWTPVSLLAVGTSLGIVTPIKTPALQQRMIAM